MEILSNSEIIPELDSFILWNNPGLGVMVAMTTAEKLRWLADREGLQPKEFAIFLGVSESKGSKWRAGTSRPDNLEFLRIARIFQVPVEWLLDDRQDAPPGAAGLSEDEQLILNMARALTFPVAKARLLGLQGREAAGAFGGKAEERTQPVFDIETGGEEEAGNKEGRAGA